MTQEPRYRQIAEELRTAITEHSYGPGGKLPSEGALAEQYEVSRGTIRQALMLLRQDGLVTSRRGTRRVVQHHAPRPAPGGHQAVLPQQHQGLANRAP